MKSYSWVHVWNPEKNTISPQLFSKMGANVWCAKQTRLGDHLSFQGIWKWCGWKWWLCKGHFIKESREMGHLVYRSLGMWFFSVESAFFDVEEWRFSLENVATPGFFHQHPGFRLWSGNIWWQTIMSYTFSKEKRCSKKKTVSRNRWSLFSFRGGIFHGNPRVFYNFWCSKNPSWRSHVRATHVGQPNSTKPGLGWLGTIPPGLHVGERKTPCWNWRPCDICLWYWGSDERVTSDDVISY